MPKRVAYITSFKKDLILKEGKRFIVSEENGVRFITPKEEFLSSLSESFDPASITSGLESYHLLTDEEEFIIDGKVFPGDTLAEKLTLAQLFKNTGYYFDEDFQDQLDKIEEKLKGKKLVPGRSQIFKALTLIDQNKVEVLILGQDPYPRIEDAMGIAFSVPSDRAIPSSLRNIIKEIESNYGEKWTGTGNLTRWVEDGVLLLNTALTTEPGIVGAHLELWKPFTYHLLSRLRPKVSFLWGMKAQAFEGYIESGEKLKCSHPSGLSVSGFTGCKHFLKGDAILGRKIKWI